MGQILQELGVEEEKLILEKEAVDTTTNAHNVLKLVRGEVLVNQVVFQILEDAQICTGGGFLSYQQKIDTGESAANNSDHCLSHAKIRLAFQVENFNESKTNSNTFF